MKDLNLRFTVDEHMFVAPGQFLTGKQIKEMAKIPADVDLFLVVRGYEDELIDDAKVVNMARPGVERFVARRRHEQEIIINGRLVKFPSHTISYEEVVRIAFPKPVTNNPEIGYTVVFAHGPEQNPKGILPPGAVVSVKHNMKFDVTPTHKS
jgi:hypothetical protein